jgi:hypothetical protein
MVRPPGCIWENCVSFSLERHGALSTALRVLCLIVFLCTLFVGGLLGQSTGSATANPFLSDQLSLSDSDSASAAPVPPVVPDEPHPQSTTAESSSRASTNALMPSSTLAIKPPSQEKFNFKGAFFQTFSENLFFHAWRVAFDPGIRYNLAHKPFWHDYAASFKGYDMSNWGDGDDFVVNDVGHPLEGAVFARSFLINDPRSHVVIGKHRAYWMSRLKAMGWAAIWSTQLELGPISETSIGNQGGFTYVPDCGTALSCLNNPKYHKPPTTNTGWTDFTVTPLIGMAWIMGEDTIDKYIVMPIAVNHRILGGRILRSALEPSRSFAALFAGKFPWQLPAPENNFMVAAKPHPNKATEPDLRPQVAHFEVGTQYSNLSLPVLSNECSSGSCRKNLSGGGFTVGYNFTRSIAFDSVVNFMPPQQGSKLMTEGLFGAKMGARFNHFGLFGKVRPGFIYYSNAMPGGGNYTATSLTRFACDFGGVFEYYPARNSTLRVDFGTTVVRYLANHPDPTEYPLGSHLSTQYWVTQGNPQFSTSYTYRFNWR